MKTRFLRSILAFFLFPAVEQRDEVCAQAGDRPRVEAEPREAPPFDPSAAMMAGIA